MADTERGNVALTDGPSAVLWVMDGDTAIKEVSYTPDNYPAWYINTDCAISSEELVKHINKNLQGWFVQKANVEGINIADDGTVEYEHDKHYI